MRRLAVRSGWAIVLGLGVVELLHVRRARLPIPFDWLWAFVPEVFLPAWLVLVGALVIGARPLFVGAAIVVIGHLLMVLPAMTGAPEEARPGAERFRLVTANVLHTTDDVTPVLVEVAAADADVVVLQEVTPEMVDEIDGVLGDYAHRELLPLPGGLGGAILARVPVRDVTTRLFLGMYLQSATLQVGAADVQLWNVHPMAPRQSDRRERRDRQLEALAKARDRVDLPLVAAGDYNATVWHPSLRELLDADLDDAASRVGRGLLTTWKGAPVIESGIDHVLVSRTSA